MTAERIGIIGVGRMGLAMLRHLRNRGHAVVVCDRDPVRVTQAVELGATAAETPSDLGARASFVILAVGYDEEVREVTDGEQGLLGTLAPGSVIAVSATVAAATVIALDGDARAKGIAVLDAPTCRGGHAADSGTLLALMGGAPDLVERARPIYGSFCSDISHVGAVGHGQVGKAINNLLLWINSIGLIEAGRLAETTGIDLPTLRAALLGSSAGSRALEDWDQTTFTWALKDMQIVSRMADAAGLSLPLTGAVRELVKDARRVKAANPPAWTTTPVERSPSP